MIKVINYKECQSLDDILLRSQFSYDDVNEKVKAILEDVKQNGDNALKKYAKMFDNADIENIEANLNNGVLIITLPKKEELKYEKKINIA